MLEILIQFITGFVITICAVFYLFYSKTISWKQVKDVFYPDAPPIVKLYRLDGKLHVWDQKFYILYCLPIITFCCALLCELCELILLICFGYSDTCLFYYLILLGFIDFFNFVVLLALTERQELIRKKRSEPSWEELNSMSDEQLKHALVAYPNIPKNSSYGIFLVSARPQLLNDSEIKQLLR